MSQKFWQNVSTNAWEETPYPWRPCYKDLAIFMFYVLRKTTKKKDAVVLLIGATRELRFLLSFFKIKYDLIDYSENMIAVTTPKHDASVRAIYHQDWFETIPSPTRYDVILGDLILNLIHKEGVATFFSIYREHMAKDGFFVLRGRLLTSSSQETAHTAIQRQLHTITRTSLYTLFANFQTLYTFTKGASEIILQDFIASTQNPEKKQLGIVLKNKYLNSSLSYVLHSKHELMRLPLPGLKIVHEYNPKDYLDSFAFIIYTP
ncbi:MAG: hypothetical protein WC444_02315 [Candidatus Paceibacterota bacterium]